MQRADSLERTLMLGKIKSRRRRGRQRVRWLDGNINSMDMSLSKLEEIMKDSPWGCKESDMTEQLNSNWWLVKDLSNWLRIHLSMQGTQLVRSLFGKLRFHMP